MENFKVQEIETENERQKLRQSESWTRLCRHTGTIVTDNR